MKGPAIPPRTFTVTPRALAAALAGPDEWHALPSRERKPLVSRARLALLRAEKITSAAT